MEIRESMEDDQMRELVHNLFAADPDDDPTGNFMYAQRVTVEEVSPDDPDTAQRNFVRALFDNSDND